MKNKRSKNLINKGVKMSWIMNRYSTHKIGHGIERTMRRHSQKGRSRMMKHGIEKWSTVECWITNWCVYRMWYGWSWYFFFLFGSFFTGLLLLFWLLFFHQIRLLLHLLHQVLNTHFRFFTRIFYRRYHFLDFNYRMFYLLFFPLF
jgi:hypothetical protein